MHVLIKAFTLIPFNSNQSNYKQYKHLKVMKRLIQSLFSCNYNEIVQCPNTNSITTTLIVGGHTMGL